MNILCIVVVTAVLALCTFCAASDVKCNLGDTYNNDCNVCTCVEIGIYVCTQRACYDGPRFPDTVGPTTEPPQSKIPLNEPGYTCTPNAVFKEDCNTCSCDSTGTLARCTAMACDPNERHKRAVADEATKIKQEKIASTVSISGQPKVISPTAPETVAVKTTPSLPPKAPETTNRAALSGPTRAPEIIARTTSSGTADRIVTTEELLNSNFRCTPSLSFKVECNTCWCAAHGKGARFCTRIACKTKNYSQ